MSEEHGRAMQEPVAAAAQWQRTLWVMVGIQFIMTGAFSVLSPIMPLLLLSLPLVWFAVDERFVAPPRARGSRSIVSSLIAVAGTPVLLALFFVLMMAQFGVRTVQPIVTLYVQELVGPAPTSPPEAASPFR